jgi:hypothetical protein
LNDGQRIDSTLTLAELELEEGDVIITMLAQRGD